MLVVRKAAERGHANHGWLHTYHTFSFANYYDVNHMGFRALRVINEDWVAPGMGFPTHGHRDMEIITYVLEGSLEHKDSLGTGSVILPGEVQRMSAGSGIYHSEFNHSQSESVHLLQIWILPEEKGIQPSYEQKAFSLQKNPGKLHLVAAKNGQDGAVKVYQDMALYAGVLQAGDRTIYPLSDDRYAWLQVARGAVTVNGTPLDTSDGAAISQESQLEITATEEAEILLFDLA